MLFVVMAHGVSIEQLEHLQTRVCLRPQHGKNFQWLTTLGFVKGARLCIGCTWVGGRQFFNQKNVSSLGINPALRMLNQL